jgi:hypothetical protein
VLDFRYHAISLVAVFLALMVGLLLGVAIGDRGLVSGADQNLRESLRSDVGAARAQSARLRTELIERRRAAEQVYPLLVEGQLSGQRIGLVGLGGLPDATIRSVREALEPSGGRLSAVTVIREPIPSAALPGAAPEDSDPAAGDTAALRRAGAQVGASLTGNGRLVARLQRTLLESSSGQLRGMTAVVVFRAPRDESGPDAARTEAFEVGLVGGLTRGAMQVVGVESIATQPSQVPWYNDRRIASVDNVDDLPGRAALVFALAGANGAYGVKDTAQALVPNTAGPTP